jgi:hypothetical protein
MQLGVRTTPGQGFLVRTGLDHVSPVENDNEAGHANGGEPMRNQSRDTAIRWLVT